LAHNVSPIQKLDSPIFISTDNLLFRYNLLKMLSTINIHVTNRFKPFCNIFAV